MLKRQSNPPPDKIFAQGVPSADALRAGSEAINVPRSRAQRAGRVPGEF